jgi:hypothetical protein
MFFNFHESILTAVELYALQCFPDYLSVTTINFGEQGPSLLFAVIWPDPCRSSLCLLSKSTNQRLMLFKSHIKNCMAFTVMCLMKHFLCLI